MMKRACRLLALLPIFSTAILASAVSAATYELPADGSDVVGEVSTVTAKFDDTLINLARRHDIGYQDIVRANPDVSVWVPGEGTEVVIPTRYVLPAGPRSGVVLNIAEYRLYYFPASKGDEPAVVMTYPISIGRMDWETPLGNTKVISKVTDPSWYPPKSVRAEHAAEGRPLARIVPAGPDNPLGKHAMRLGLPGYLIHGTNRPAGVGMRVTHGCLRMFPEDIRYLFNYVAVDTPVRIINEPVKIGWQGDALVLEAHPILESSVGKTSDEPSPDDAIAEDAPDAVDVVAEDDSKGDKDPLTYVTEQFIVATAERAGELDWSLVEAAISRSDGMPVSVGAGIKNAATSAASE
jgi:L,D-transpeptidase ErfK/SrfK